MSRFLCVVISLLAFTAFGKPADATSPAPKLLEFHTLRTDANGHILPWNNPDPAAAYDEILKLTWTYWRNVPGYWLRKEKNVKERFGIEFPPTYLLFRTHDPVDMGVGGGQFSMLLSSLNRYYDYTGDPAVLENMRFLADWYIKWGFSGADAAWPNLPYPCNTQLLPVYDGDLVLGKGFTQPDKAGEFGYELVVLYKKTGDKRYLDKAVQIAETLASKVQPGDRDHSPLPFKVNALTGEIGSILGEDHKTRIASVYTTNWTGTLRLLRETIALKAGNNDAHVRAFDLISDWMKTYPLANQRWGPYFEDITMWSDTEINAGMMAWFIMDYPNWVDDWRAKVRGIQDWVVANLGVENWRQYGVGVIGEQTVYKMYGQSHTSRHASIELRYAELTGDTSRVVEAVRQLNWCTYSVDRDGKNKWPHPTTYEIWWTDGYGDFIRHFLRAMAARPELCPAEPHLLSSTGVVTRVLYAGAALTYTTHDTNTRDRIRVPQKPKSVRVGGKPAKESAASDAGWRYTALDRGGVVDLVKTDRDVEITW